FLQRKRRTYTRTSGAEHGDRFVTAQLHELSILLTQYRSGDLNEASSQIGSRFVAMVDSETGISADVSDQEHLEPRRRLLPRHTKITPGRQVGSTATDGRPSSAVSADY